MVKKLNNKKIVKEIKDNGFHILEDCISKQDLNKIKHSLLKTLHYIKPNNENDLQKKYYQIKKYSPKLKGNWFDIISCDTSVLQFLYSPKIIDIVKKFFGTDVVFSGRRHLNVFDDANDKLLSPHQETHQLSRDTLLLWAPLYDTNKKNGGLAVYKDSHKHGYFKHNREQSRSGDKRWTGGYNQVDRTIAERFEKIELEIKAGSALLMQSKVLHCGYPTKKKGFVRIVLTERYNPLQKIPFLRDENAPMNIPIVGVDYNKILD